MGYNAEYMGSTLKQTPQGREARTRGQSEKRTKSELTVET